MLTKEDVMKNAEEYFVANGFDVRSNETELVIIKDSKNFHVVSMGTIGDASSTSKKGKTFNKNQVRNILGLALFEASKVMTDHPNFGCKFVLPDNKIYLKLLKGITSGLELMSIEVFIMSEVGQVTLYK